jgi:hypothetical protein
VGWEITEDEERASFEIVELAELPAVDRDDIPTVPSLVRPCGCSWCEADWLLIAACSVAILEEGLDPLDHDAVALRAVALGLEGGDLGWLVSLFTPHNAIVVLRDSHQFTNGMHRTHALRMAGVKRCVVYTGRGELPYVEDDLN